MGWNIPPTSSSRLSVARRWRRFWGVGGMMRTAWREWVGAGIDGKGDEPREGFGL